MTASEHLVQVHPDVVDTELDGAETGVAPPAEQGVFQPECDRHAHLAGTKRGSSLAAISRQLQETFDVDAAHADTSVLALIEDLERQGLVVEDTGEPS